MGENNSIQNVVQIIYLTTQNSRFYKKGDFLALETKLNNDEGVPEEKDNGVIKLRRMFPFEELWTTISVMNEEDEEIGLIKDITDFDAETEKMLRDELYRVYFVPKISQILEMKDKYGFSNWKVTTNVGILNFMVRDTYRAMLRLPNGRVFISDVDGNRYEIEDVDKLDKKSAKKIELYL